ncbi:cilia- and flagella-associated protein 276 isoform X2 [Lepisosteus oculatus]|uniref:cilia- and flagella-associated protein 276 isoform X2 n=1 Tax=Lepisosteus oculatus TaxID=7918 RepID=UPI00371DC9E8
MPRSRDPFPYPKYENDDTFIGKPKNCQKVPYSKPTHLAQNEDPWNRLNARATLSSARREVLYFDPEVPQDRLDFQLKSLYDHHEEFLKDKNETLYQRETFTEDHGEPSQCIHKPRLLQETGWRILLYLMLLNSSLPCNKPSSPASADEQLLTVNAL